MYEYQNGIPLRCLLMFVTYHRNVVMAEYGDLMELHPSQYRCFDPGPTNCLQCNMIYFQM